jgi:hypothetical protein
MNTLILRFSALTLAIGLCAGVLSGCVAEGGGYGYNDNVAVGVGLDYYEPYGAVYGGWGPGYRVAPFRGGDYHGVRGGAGHAYRSAPASHAMPSIPSGSRGRR